MWKRQYTVGTEVLQKTLGPCKDGEAASTAASSPTFLVHRFQWENLHKPDAPSLKIFKHKVPGSLI